MSTTIKPNRAARRAAAAKNFSPVHNDASSLKRKARHSKFVKEEKLAKERGKQLLPKKDARETINADGSATTLHPTKGFRKISPKRLKAIALIHQLFGIGGVK